MTHMWPQQFLGANNLTDMYYLALPLEQGKTKDFFFMWADVH